MAKRFFMGSDKFLPELIAENILAGYQSGTAPDLSNILLTLPGKLARQKVTAQLAEKAEHGVLLPQILTPSQLLRYNTEQSGLPPPMADELLWMQTVKEAVRTPEKFDLLFSEVSPPGDHLAAGRKFQALRNETSRGGISLAQLAPFAGERGSQLAGLEKIYLRQLEKAGYSDPLALDLLAAGDITAFVPGMKIIIAGIPDMPNMLRKKLENIDRLFPDMIEIWIHAPETQQHEFDQWGVPIADIWLNKPLLLPENSWHLVLNPAQAAYFSAHLAVKHGSFMPEKCAVVLSDPEMTGVFRTEFGKFTDPQGNPLEVFDPSGVPMRKLRLWQLGHKLCALLKNDGDFTCAVELLRSHDYMLHLGAAVEILPALDEFTARSVPDDLAQAVILAENENLNRCGSGIVKAALKELCNWQKLLNALSVPEFLREFFRTVYPETLAIDNESVEQVPFAAECAVFRKQLEEFESIPGSVTGLGSKLQLLEIFFNRCGNASAAAVPGNNAYDLEGCLEMPFLDAEQIIFCGLNDKFFPDRIDTTPFLTDSIRRKAGLRSNRETGARARCHLQSVLECRKSGNVDFLILRRDETGDVLRPSTLLFAGDALPEDELITRCDLLFKDPDILPEAAGIYGKKQFRLLPELDCLREKDSGLPRLSPTFLDDYLTSPYLFYLRRVRQAEVVEYLREEPDARLSGILLHRAVELLGTAHFTSASALEKALERNFDRALAERFGEPPHPVLIGLLADNLRQRLKPAAELLFREQCRGFQPLAHEYKLENVELAGALFSGKIDLIEYNPGLNILRIVDMKTGKYEPVADAHCKKSGAKIEFHKLQLPLYVLLLKSDPGFREKFPETANAGFECAYLNLPQSVTDSCLEVWNTEDFEAVLPAALEKTAQIIAGILNFPEHILSENPDKFRKNRKCKDWHFLFPGGMRNGIAGVKWDEPEPPSAGSDSAEGRKKKAVEAEIVTPETLVIPAAPEKICRCCDCPESRRQNCSCFHGMPGDCKSFNGFKCFNVITASAGTGKTTRLAMRFIQLLAYGADPAQIMAVTFTKDAAGEIFDSIIKWLLTFAGGACDMNCRQLDRHAVLEILRKLLNSEKELQIGTIDSFFMKLVTIYAPELGIWGDISVTDQKDLRRIRRTIREWIREVSGSGQLDTLREMLKSANVNENRGFAGSLLEILKDVYPFYLTKVRRSRNNSMPQLEYFPWSPDVGELLAPETLENISDVLREFAGQLRAEADFAKTAVAKSMRLCASKMETLADFLPVSLAEYGKLDDVVNDFFANILERNGENWSYSEGELFYTQKLTFPPLCSDLIRKAFRHIRTREFGFARRKTRAVFGMMEAFDKVYNSLVRSAGNLTFTDLPYLLCHFDPATSEAILGQSDRSMEARLDNEINHYMFDEFQDTSDIQYQAFDGLIKELVSGESDRFRSFFCVGDIKQSIYQWRDGDPALFAYLLNILAPAAEKRGYDPRESLTLSFRTCQSILNTVNRIFAPGYSGELPFFADAVKKMQFEPHSAARNMEGFAALIEYAKEPGRDTVFVSGKAKVIFDIIREINPLKKHLTVGVLVQKNDTVEAFAEELRTLARDAGYELPVSADGVVTISDSMAFNVFRFMLILAGHPQDTLAKEFLNTVTFDLPGTAPQALGMDEIAKKMGFPKEVALDESVRQEIFHSGIAGVAKRFIDGFGAEMTPYDRKRMESAWHAAGKFSGTPEEFIENIDILSSKEAALDNTIQIMTFHRSKGLGFDIVFLPDTATPAGRGGSTLLPEVMSMDMDMNNGVLPEPEWISYLPRTGITGEVPVFADNERMKKAAKAFERCCALYVALTRVKRALYVIISPGSGSTGMALDQIMLERLRGFGPQAADREWFSGVQERTGLGDRLTLHYSCGRESWHGLIPEYRDDVREIPDIPREIAGGAGNEKIIHASEEKSSVISPERRFSTAGGMTVGTGIHELMEKIIRIEASSWDAGEFCRKNLPDSPYAPVIRNIFCTALAPDSEIFTMLCNVDPECEVWNERRFMVNVSGLGMISGAFDRVVIRRDNGVPAAAEIFDWKSDDLASPEQFLCYGEQLRIYRRALAQLLNLPENSIRANICALKLKKIIFVA